jgi:hypothetical protein
MSCPPDGHDDDVAAPARVGTVSANNAASVALDATRARMRLRIGYLHKG